MRSSETIKVASAETHVTGKMICGQHSVRSLQDVVIVL